MSGTFFVLLSALTAQVYCWIASLAIFGLIGVNRIRAAVKEDWEGRWAAFAAEYPEKAGNCHHIVILPNYKEDESMLWETLDNLARFPRAAGSMHVVLAMEAREGEAARQKAERLIQGHKALFSDIIATFHPENLPGETAGKSANCQWAFREVQRRYGPRFGHCADTVFLTVGDADTLWHPNFFTALALDGMRMTELERSWAMWQCPVLLLRNYTTVPGPIRVSGYAAFCFELSGLTGQDWLGSHLCYSAYSLTLALANHPLVDGWDTDVIAEDHHMFCKCLFASIRDSKGCPEITDKKTDVSKPRQMTSRVKLNPIYLPVVSYMVEDSTGWMASCHARFQQARRHSQGIAELSYTLFQYINLLNSVGFSGLTKRAHKTVISIIIKMSTVHLTNTLHAFAVMLTSHCASMSVWGMLTRGELFDWMTVTLPAMLSEGNGMYWTAASILGSFLPLSLMMSYTSYQVVKDCVEGRMVPFLEKRKPDAEGIPPTQEPKSLEPYMRTALAALILFDYAVLAETTVVIFGLIPEVLACFSLARTNKFEYIVAAKPN
eukprot:gnl/MRDRNA2_/MRDRNA2_141482_c0_seq1.p1 gnl/MRDRNA2_/MRDRNA2_141482_c0~~gnl/MRDRNA2_/MRDRNA2_141482_c0_seq1.p1  ORF type:complete len:639 (-),score=80.13 gnl/MRDRNA2_/MRDRNA2_141482_c0_seq1:77-1726(-)